MTERTQVRAWIGLGSNLDNPVDQLRRALDALRCMPQSELLRHSRLYRSAPWGFPAQPDFINAVAELATTLAPRHLLDALLGIERRHGRRRDATRWGPRTLDLDLLSYANVESAASDLVLPHPQIGERAFVLMPLAELDAELSIAGAGRVSELLARLDTSDCVAIDEIA